MKILSKNQYNELINLKKLNETEQAELEKYEMLKQQTSMKNGTFYGKGYIAFNADFWTAYLKDLQNEKAILQNKLNEIGEELNEYIRTFNGCDFWRIKEGEVLANKTFKRMLTIIADFNLTTVNDILYYGLTFLLFMVII